MLHYFDTKSKLVFTNYEIRRIVLLEPHLVFCKSFCDVIVYLGLNRTINF